MPPNEADDFHQQVMNILPQLRRYAFSLTHNRDAADDLVQDTVVRALHGRHSFQPGTNLAAWLFRIQRNQFISGVRKQRPTDDIDVAMSVFSPPQQENGLIMREFVAAFFKLDAGQREAVVLAVLDGQKLEDIAALRGVAVGTVKSRISRARDRLALLLRDEPRRAVTARRKRRHSSDSQATSLSATH